MNEKLKEIMKKVLLLLAMIVLFIVILMISFRLRFDSLMSTKSEGTTQKSSQEKSVEQPNGTDDKEKINTNITIEEQVLGSYKDVVFTAKELVYGDGYVVLILSAENTGEEEIRAEVYGLEVNKYTTMIGSSDIDLKPGECGEIECLLFHSTLLELGVIEPAEFQIYVKVAPGDYDRDAYDEYWERRMSDVLSVAELGVFQLKTSAADSYDSDINTYRNYAEQQAGYYSTQEWSSPNGIVLRTESVLRDEKGEEYLQLEVYNGSTEIREVSIQAYADGIYYGEGDKSMILPQTSVVISLRKDELIAEYLKETFGEIHSREYTVIMDEGGNRTTAVFEVSQEEAMDVGGSIVYEQNGIRIRAVDITKEEGRIAVWFLLENDRTMDFREEDSGVYLCIINDYQFWIRDEILYAVAPGQAALCCAMPESDEYSHCDIDEDKELEVEIEISYKENESFEIIYFTMNGIAK